jgi:formate dehydrogenase iron-sulfur subunit
LGAVACSVMVYAATRRPAWRTPLTTVRFLLSTLVLGSATVALTATLLSAERERLFALLAISSAAKLLFELAVFRHLSQRQHTELKRTALLMLGDLATVTFWRFACGAFGGVFLAALVWIARPSDGGFAMTVSAAIFVLVLVGELCERHLFFAATTAPRMPGAPA